MARIVRARVGVIMVLQGALKTKVLDPLSKARVVVHLQGKTRFLQKKECCAGALEGRFIATLCRLTGAKTVLEVGMFTGTTTLAVAQQLPADGKARLAGTA